MRNTLPNEQILYPKNEELIKILETLKEDFEMLQDGTWDLNYSDGSEIQASIDNVEKAIKIVKDNG
tara:strand:+ start:632 stop:829 length:198 start_codon:yes stop_codon:yes gene_type:complete